VRHEFELRHREVALVERETFESSLRLGRSVLEDLGFSPYEARQSADRFRRHNRDTILALLEHYGDEERMVSGAREARNELEESMRKDRELRQRNHHEGW
jgi:glutathione-regulated potassium-efflux system ancillary protein KefC